MYFLDKAVRLTAKQIAIENKILQPNKGVGQSAYVLKRDGRSQSFTTLAVFENFRTNFDKFRHRLTFEFALPRNTSFVQKDGSTKTMTQIAMIHTHIAIVEADGSTVLYATNDGDQYEPYYMDWTWKFYGRQIGDVFDP